MIIKTKKFQETIELGKELGKKLRGGEVFFLSGQLGGGKTVFVKGIAKGLKIKEQVTSPTFTLCQQYVIPSKKLDQLVHVDLYRLEKRKEIMGLGLEEFFTDRNVVFIEWSKRLKDMFSNFKAIEVEFVYNKENERKIIFKNLHDYLNLT